LFRCFAFSFGRLCGGLGFFPSTDYPTGGSTAWAVLESEHSFVCHRSARLGFCFSSREVELHTMRTPPIKPGRSIGKKRPSRKFSDFRFSRPQNGNSDLVSCCSVSDGVRLNTYWDSIGPVCSPSLRTLNHTGPSSAAIQRRGAVQKHTQSTQGLSIQIEDGSRLTARGRGVDDSSSVRTCLWGGCSKVVPRLLVGAHRRCFHCPLFGNEGNRRPEPVLSPSPLFCRSEHG
jgi:hypothetical protein